MAIKSLLKDFQFEFFTALNGEEAYNIVKTNIFRCEKCFFFKFIVMDFNMPILGGIDSTKKILAILTESKRRIDFDNILVVGLSAYTDEETVNEAYQAGMVKVLAKPANKYTLMQTLKEINIV